MCCSRGSAPRTHPAFVLAHLFLGEFATNRRPDSVACHQTVENGAPTTNREISSLAWSQTPYPGRQMAGAPLSGLYLGTLDARKASVVPKRPLNLQIWTTDAEDASVVQKHIYPLVAWPTTQAGAPARAASTKALAAASKPPARKPRGNRWRAARLDPLLPRRQPALAAHPNVQEHGRPGPIGPPGQRDLVDLVVGHG
jgi:hypothetical protein